MGAVAPWWKTLTSVESLLVMRRVMRWSTSPASGCRRYIKSAFIRLQLSRHFKESIALNSTAMSEDTAIFGGWENLKKGLKKVIDKFAPGVVGVMTSGLTETMGDDVRSAIVHFRRENPEYDGIPVVWA